MMFKSSAWIGTLRERHWFLGSAELLVEDGASVCAGDELAQILAASSAIAVPASTLEGVEPGETVPAGTAIGPGGGWLRGEPDELPWDGLVNYIDVEAGQVYLEGPPQRWTLRSRLTGVVEFGDDPGLITVTGPGLSVWCPIASGHQVHGQLQVALEQPPDQPTVTEPTIVVLSTVPKVDERRWSDQICGIVAPSLNLTMLASSGGMVDLGTDMREIRGGLTLGLSEGFGDAPMSPTLLAAISALDGNSACLLESPRRGGGQLVVSGPIGNQITDPDHLRVIGADGPWHGAMASAEALTVALPGSRPTAAVTVEGPNGPVKVPAVNCERVLTGPT